MSRSERGRGINSWAAGILIGLFVYSAAYLAARHHYGYRASSGLPVGMASPPARFVWDHTSEGAMVRQLNGVFRPAIWLDRKMTGTQVDFFPMKMVPPGPNKVDSGPDSVVPELLFPE